MAPILFPKFTLALAREKYVSANLGFISMALL